MTEKDRKIIEHAEKTGTPIFVLTAKDAASIQTLKDYRQHCKSIGSPESHTDGVTIRIFEFQDWELENKKKVKIPD